MRQHTAFGVSLTGNLLTAITGLAAAGHATSIVYRPDETPEISPVPYNIDADVSHILIVSVHEQFGQLKGAHVADIEYRAVAFGMEDYRFYRVRATARGGEMILDSSEPIDVDGLLNDARKICYREMEFQCPNETELYRLMTSKLTAHAIEKRVDFPKWALLSGTPMRGDAVAVSRANGQSFIASTHTMH